LTYINKYKADIMSTTPKQEKSKSTRKAPVKKLPNTPLPPKGAEEQPKPTSFVITPEGVNDIAECVNQVGGSKYAKQALFAALNEHLKPVFE
jgi:hypothetical protein